MKNGRLYGVGVGPGDPELITLKAIKTIKNCSKICIPNSGAGENVALEIVRKAIGEIDNNKIIEVNMPMTRDEDLLNYSHDIAANTLIDIMKNGEDIAFLTLGDPSIYSTYIYIHYRVLERGFDAMMIPGVPSFCAVAARLNQGLVESGEALHIIPASYNGTDEGLNFSGCKVLMKTGKKLPKVINMLKEKGLINSTKMVEKCGMIGERVYENLDEIDSSLSYFSTIIVKDKE
ncbi:MAG: precorrin-2 C(20)-methyltransferase [Clostridium sp.]